MPTLRLVLIWLISGSPVVVVHGISLTLIPAIQSKAAHLYHEVCLATLKPQVDAPLLKYRRGIPQARAPRVIGNSLSEMIVRNPRPRSTPGYSWSEVLVYTWQSSNQTRTQLPSSNYLQDHGRCRINVHNRTVTSSRASSLPYLRRFL